MELTATRITRTDLRFRLTKNVSTEGMPEVKKIAKNSWEKKYFTDLTAFLGIYFEEGCAHKFSVWLKAWAGCTTFVCLVVVGIEVATLMKNIYQCQISQFSCCFRFSSCFG